MKAFKRLFGWLGLSRILADIEDPDTAHRLIADLMAFYSILICGVLFFVYLSGKQYELLLFAFLGVVLCSFVLKLNRTHWSYLSRLGYL